MKFDRIKSAIADYQKAMQSNIMEDGRHRSDYFGIQLRIAQAACNYNGYIVTGTRHFCPIMNMQIDAIGEKLLHEWCGGLAVQGFTDQYGRFYGRKEAYVIAKAAGQIIRDDPSPGTLFSECYV